MTQLTPAQVSLLRTRPHNTKLWLSIYQPSTKLAARVNNASAAKNDRYISYDGVTAGSYLLLEEGMTLMIGSGLGKNDKGEVRIRSANPTGIADTIWHHIAVTKEANVYSFYRSTEPD